MFRIRRRFFRHLERMSGILRILADSPEPLTGSEICRRASLPSGSHHRLLSAMYREGLIVRNWREGHQQPVTYSLTPIGRQAARSAGG